MRLHELAKEIGAESKVLLKLAKEIGLGVKNHSSNLEVGQVAILKAAYKEEFGDTATAEEEAPPAEEPKAKPRRRRRKKPAAADETPTEEPATVGVAAEMEAEAEVESDVDVDVEPAFVAEVEVESSAEPEAVEEPAEPMVVEAESEAPQDDATDDSVAEPAPEPVRPAARRRDDPGLVSDPTIKPAASTGKPPQTPTPRKRSGARILGRIELPAEEKNRARERAAPADPTQFVDPSMPPSARGRGHDPASPETREMDRRRQQHGRPKEDSLGWNPDDEDDPLLQGIRVRNAQMGPHTRRPPRRVGPRRSTRRQAPALPTGPIDVVCPISVRDLSQVLGVKVTDILRSLLSSGTQAHANMALEEDLVLEIATALNREVNLSSSKGKEDEFLEEVEAMEKELAAGKEGAPIGDSRAPVVAFLGHVDHGKTSLLDYIRKTEVAAGEAGGITQSMRAYSVSSPGGGSITFLDTPGHKAFTEMRARGAHVTDIVVLVVAADDGVMPQTAEAIQHALAAEVPIVVAVNKVDRVEANVDRVLQQLAQENVLVEGWGGEVQYAPVSAITGDGIDDLLEKISLQAEVMELTADPSRSAKGTVLEARKDDTLGAVATALVQEGTLRTGDVLLSGTAYGRIRKLIDDQGRSIEEAGPSMPVNIIGLNAAPNASDSFYVVESQKKAREVAEERAHAERQERVAAAGPTGGGQITLENLFAAHEAGKVEEMKIVLRCDVKGSLEVVRRSLQELEQKEVKVKIIREALGGITEDDVVLAVASQAIVVGFNVIADDKARAVADDKGVDVRTYQVIYELIDDVKAAMEGLLSPIKKENVVGHVEIREVFKVSRLGNIAGCRVQDGVIRRNSTVRLTRDGRILHTGTLESLRRIKDDVREVKEGLECGLRLSGYDDIKVGDIIEVIEVAEERRTLDFAAS